MTPDQPRPDAAAMSDEELLDRLVDAAVQAAESRLAWRREIGAEANADVLRDFQEKRRVLDRHKAIVLRRMAGEER